MRWETFPKKCFVIVFKLALMPRAFSWFDKRTYLKHMSLVHSHCVFNPTLSPQAFFFLCETKSVFLISIYLTSFTVRHKARSNLSVGQVQAHGEQVIQGRCPLLLAHRLDCVFLIGTTRVWIQLHTCI